MTSKNYKKRKEIENDVLKIYRKVSPSHRNLINDKTKKQFFRQRINLMNTLGLPLTFFQNKKIKMAGPRSGWLAWASGLEDLETRSGGQFSHVLIEI